MKKQTKGKDVNQMAGYILGRATGEIPKERPDLLKKSKKKAIPKRKVKSVIIRHIN
jgi:hypothetical protein